MRRLVTLMVIIGLVALGCPGDSSDGTDTANGQDAPAVTDVPAGKDAPPAADVAVATDTAVGEEVDSGKCTNGTAIDWVSIPGGTFQMGSASDTTEMPAHPVTVPAFRMSRTEVMVCQYDACVTAGSCTAAGGYQPVDNRPVVYVTWDQSKAYCLWAGGRLCTEAEWEYAARNGSTDTAYPWGNTETSCTYAVSFQCGNTPPDSPSASCSIPAGNDSWGVCDLASNATEWVEDCYQDSYDGAPADGSARESCTTFCTTMPCRVIRGGNYAAAASTQRSASRGGGLTTVNSINPVLGARCCTSP